MYIKLNTNSFFLYTFSLGIKVLSSQYTKSCIPCRQFDVGVGVRLVTKDCTTLGSSNGSGVFKSLFQYKLITCQPVFLLCPADQVSAERVFHCPLCPFLYLVFIMGVCICSVSERYAPLLLCCTNKDFSV